MLQQEPQHAFIAQVVQIIQLFCNLFDIIALTLYTEGFTETQNFNCAMIFLESPP